jgi:hypothetical protein
LGGICEDALPVAVIAEDLTEHNISQEQIVHFNRGDRLGQPCVALINVKRIFLTANHTGFGFVFSAEPFGFGILLEQTAESRARLRIRRNSLKTAIIYHDSDMCQSVKIHKDVGQLFML